MTKLYVYDNLILVKNLSTKIEIRALMNTFHKMYIIRKGARHTMDRRQKKTRQAIIDAFVKLLTKTSYEKVSVKDIMGYRAVFILFYFVVGAIVFPILDKII